jgi:hypothetical protein
VTGDLPLLLKFIFNLSLSMQVFSDLKKKAAVPVFEKGEKASVMIALLAISVLLLRYSSLLNYENISLYIHTKLSLSRSVCTKTKSTATNLATCLDEVTVTLCSQGQYDSIYFDLSSSLDFVLHIVPLDNLITYGLSTGYVD